MKQLNTIAYFFLLTLNILLFVSDKSGDQLFSYGLSIILTFTFSISTIWWNSHKEDQAYNSLTNPVYIILLGLFIVNFQTIVNVVLGIAPITYYLNTNEYSSYTGKVTYAGSIGICSFMWAYSHYKPKLRAQLGRQLDWGGVWPILTLIVFVGFILNINVVFFISGEDYVASGSYDRVNKGYAVYEMLFDVFNTITLATYISKHYRDCNKKLTVWAYLKIFPIYLLIINIIYIFLRALSGDRGPVIYTLLMFFFAYIYMSKRKMKKRFVIAAVIASVFVIAVANVVRSEDHEAKIMDRIVYGIQDRQGKIIHNSISPYTQELASSINCNFIAIHDITEEKTSYKFGQYSILQLLGAMPGMSSLYQHITGKKFAASSGEYLTQSFLGKYYSIGLGTTPIAEFFMDFGIFGIIFGFLLIGAIYKKLDYMLLSHSKCGVLSLIMLLKLSSMSVYLPRASLTLIITKGLYTVIVYLIISSIFRIIVNSKINCYHENKK